MTAEAEMTKSLVINSMNYNLKIHYLKGKKSEINWNYFH